MRAIAPQNKLELIVSTGSNADELRVSLLSFILWTAFLFECCMSILDKQTNLGERYPSKRDKHISTLVKRFNIEN